MKPNSFLGRPFQRLISGRAAFMLVTLVLGGLVLAYAYQHVGELSHAVNAKKSTSGTSVRVAAPALTVETNLSFQYEQWMEMLGSSRVPTAPNTWHIDSKMTNRGASPIEVLPLYLYSEVYPSGPGTFENSATICPKSYTHAFSPGAQNELTVAPEDLSGEIQKDVALPADPLDHLPDLSQGGSLAAMIGSRTFAAALNADAKPVRWGKVNVSPNGTINVAWEFESIWAVPRKVRVDSAFEMIHLGPLVRSASTKQAYLVVVRLNYDPNQKGMSLKQSLFRLQEITSTLPQDLSKAFPNNRPSVEEFGNAALKIASEP